MIGSDPPQSFDSVTALLGADHDRLDAILANVKKGLREGDRGAAASDFAAFREGLERHIVAEEEVLFPVFEEHTGVRDAGPTAVMRMEHVQIRELLAELAALLGGDGSESHTTPMASLTALLAAHNGKEERILYPMIDSALGDEASRRGLVDRIQAL